MRDIDAPHSFPSRKLGLVDNQEATKGSDKARDSFFYPSLGLLAQRAA
jgi:hypothetical protein